MFVCFVDQNLQRFLVEPDNVVEIIRVAVGPQQGRKVFTLRKLPAPARRGKGRRKVIGQDKTPEERQSARPAPEGIKALRLKKIFKIDVKTCTKLVSYR